MSISHLLTHAAYAWQAATPKPTPAPGLDAQADVTLSNFWIAVLLFVGSVAVITIALRFAFSYHNKLLGVVKSAVDRGDVSLTIDNSDVATLSAEPAIDGPNAGTPSAKLKYGLIAVDPTLTISWVADKGDPSSGHDATFATRFDSAGSYKVVATYTDSNGQTKTLTRDVKIAAEPTPAATTPGIVLPFVIKNWGRLVIVIFGVGVISALMSTKILDAAAGVGILGTLLGAGAATATSGTSGDKSPSTTDE